MSTCLQDAFLSQQDIFQQRACRHWHKSETSVNMGQVKRRRIFQDKGWDYQQEMLLSKSCSPSTWPLPASPAHSHSNRAQCESLFPTGKLVAESSCFYNI